MPYKLVCFDMDGVLYSSETMIAAAFQSGVTAFTEKTRTPAPVPDLEQIMEEVGKPIESIYANLYPQFTKKQQDEISLLTLNALNSRVRNKEGTLLPNAFEVLQQLQENGIKIGLASNGRGPYLDAILETYQIDRFFPERAIINNTDLPTKGSLIAHAMKKHGISKTETLMIGDRLTDFDAAKENKVDFACVLSGHGSDFSNQQFTWSIHNLIELIPIVLGENHAGI